MKRLPTNKRLEISPIRGRPSKKPPVSPIRGRPSKPIRGRPSALEKRNKLLNELIEDKLASYHLNQLEKIFRGEDKDSTNSSTSSSPEFVTIPTKKLNEKLFRIENWK